MKPVGKGQSRKKINAKYNGVTLPANSTERRRMRNKLSAQVHRKRKDDALKTAKDAVEVCNVAINKLKAQLDKTRARINPLQSIMDAIERELGADAVTRIFAQSNGEAGAMTPMRRVDCAIIRSVISDSDTTRSTSSDEESSIWC